MLLGDNFSYASYIYFLFLYHVRRFKLYFLHFVLKFLDLEQQQLLHLLVVELLLLEQPLLLLRLQSVLLLQEPVSPLIAATFYYYHFYDCFYSNSIIYQESKHEVPYSIKYEYLPRAVLQLTFYQHSFITITNLNFSKRFQDYYYIDWCVSFMDLLMVIFIFHHRCY